MADLEVNPFALQATAAYFEALADDATRLPAYVSDHCPRQWSYEVFGGASLLDALTVGHGQFVDLLEQGSADIPPLLRGVQGALLQTFDAYTRNELENIEATEAIFPTSGLVAPRDPSVIGPTKPSYELSGDANLPDWADPSRHLVPPDHEAPGIETATGDLAAIIDAYETLPRPGWFKDLRNDLVIDFVLEGLVGDWNGMYRCGVALTALPQYHDSLATLIRDSGAALGHEWSGDAADQAEQYLASLANAVQQQGFELPVVGDAYINLANVIATLMEGITLIIDTAISILSTVLAGLTVTAVTGIGPAIYMALGVIDTLFGFVANALSVATGATDIVAALQHEIAAIQLPTSFVTLPPSAGDPNYEPDVDPELIPKPAVCP